MKCSTASDAACGPARARSSREARPAMTKIPNPLKAGRPGLVAALLLAFAYSASASAAGGRSTDPARGERLYQQHCGACHTPGIHYRRDTLPMSRDELLGLVDLFRRQAGLAWTPEEIDDVVEYLNRTRYHFPRN